MAISWVRSRGGKGDNAINAKHGKQDGRRGKAGDEHCIEAARGLAFCHHTVHGFDIGERELRIDGANYRAQ
jgi:hypothetical protein